MAYTPTTQDLADIVRRFHANQTDAPPVYTPAPTGVGSGLPSATGPVGDILPGGTSQLALPPPDMGQMPITPVSAVSPPTPSSAATVAPAPAPVPAPAPAPAPTPISAPPTPQPVAPTTSAAPGHFNVPNVNATVLQRLNTWYNSLTPEEAAGVSIISGYRTPEHQAELYARGGIVAPPGRSAHNVPGGAVGVDVGGMSPSAAAKLRAAGLAQNVPGDPIHVEPIEIPSAASATADTRYRSFLDFSGGKPFASVTGPNQPGLGAPNTTPNTIAPGSPAPAPGYDPALGRTADLSLPPRIDPITAAQVVNMAGLGGGGLGFNIPGAPKSMADAFTQAAQQQQQNQQANPSPTIVGGPLPLSYRLS